MKNIITTYLVLLIIISNGLSQSFTIKSNTDSVLIGIPIEVTLKLEQINIKEITWPIFSIGDSLGDSFEITEILKKDTTKKETVLSQQLTLTSFDPGLKTLKPIIINGEKGIITSNSLKIYVSLLKADTTQPIKDIKPIVVANITFKDRFNMFLSWLKTNWYYGILMLAVFIFLIWFLFFQKKKQQEQQVKKEPVKPSVPAHILAFNSLKQLEKEELWQKGKQKEYNVKLTNVVKKYIADRYKISTLEKTTDQILQEKKLVIVHQNRENLRKLLTLSDLVKFAKKLPTEEQNRRVMQDAIDFVETTKKQNQ